VLLQVSFAFLRLFGSLQGNKVLRVRLRNWNNCENLQLYFKAYWDAPYRNAGCERCTDFSMVSDLYRDTWLTGAIAPEWHTRVRDYFDLQFSESIGYEKKYNKSPGK